MTTNPAVTTPVAHAVAPTSESAVQPLALRPRDAAVALGIGVRLLWQLTNAGEIPHPRIGGAVVYPVKDLTEWLSRRAADELQP